MLKKYKFTLTVLFLILNISNPAAAQINRQGLIGFVDDYLKALVAHDPDMVPMAAKVKFTENGTQTTNNPSKNPGLVDITAIGCREQFESGFFRFVTRIRDRRFVVVDEERGLVFAFVFFDHAGNVPTVQLTSGVTVPIGVNRPWTWEIAELFTVENGLIRQIQAVCRECPYGMNSGWSEWDQGMSGEIQQ